MKNVSKIYETIGIVSEHNKNAVELFIIVVKRTEEIETPHPERPSLIDGTCYEKMLCLRFLSYGVFNWKVIDTFYSLGGSAKEFATGKLLVYKQVL